MSNLSQQVRCPVWWLEILATVVYVFVVLFGAAVLPAVVCLVQRGQVAGCAINPRNPLLFVCLFLVFILCLVLQC